VRRTCSPDLKGNPWLPSAQDLPHFRPPSQLRRRHCPYRSMVYSPEISPGAARRQLLYQAPEPARDEGRRRRMRNLGAAERRGGAAFTDLISCLSYISVLEAHVTCSAGPRSTCVRRRPSSRVQLSTRQWALHMARVRSTTFRELARYCFMSEFLRHT
jgi:hypothetical protein